MKKSETVLVTGATSGIGFELAKTFAQNGYNLILVARNEEKLKKITKDFINQYDVSVDFLSKDLSIPSAPQEIYQYINQKNLSVDILVNNAGFNVYGPFVDTDIQQELELLQVNLISLTYLTKLFLPGMISRKKGKILNVGSTGSFAPVPFNSVYCASKAYVLCFSDALAEELKGTGITVTTLCPGATQTEFALRANMSEIKLFQNNVMQANTVAKQGYNALIKGKRTIVTGCMNKLTVLSIRFTPRNIVTKLGKYLMTS